MSRRDNVSRLSVGLLADKGQAQPQVPVAPPSEAANGRVALTLRISPQIHDQLRALAFHQRRTMQDIVMEAVERQLGVMTASKPAD